MEVATIGAADLPFRINFDTNAEAFRNDFMDVIRAFYPHVICSEDGMPLKFELRAVDGGQGASIYLDGALCVEERVDVADIDVLKKKSQLKRTCKLALYRFLCRKCGVTLPYGSLTGIRPTHLFHDIAARGEDASAYFRDKLGVSPAKTQLIATIEENQRTFYARGDDAVDIFINVPLCTSRCSYCSFISAEISKVKKFVTPYCDNLIEEILHAHELVARLGKKVDAVYIGGGTPTSLDKENFHRVLEVCDFDCGEFTVEAGRPDTITHEKLDIMAACGVTRISVNPQSFNQKTLDAIGRAHTVEDIYRVYGDAKKYGFDINMDLIAALPGESEADFDYSVDMARTLAPQNVTVHTLALKRGSRLRDDGYDNADKTLAASRMVDYAYAALTSVGYNPYYMYRQKYVSGNLENVGYCLDGKACSYNVDIMEELRSIIGCGAGAMSKYVDRSRAIIERLPQPKGLDVYLKRGASVMCAAKSDFFIRER